MKWEKELPYLWDEYQYRHDLVWRVALRLGLVVATLSVIPYAKDSLTRQMGHWMVVPPILAFVLAVFGSCVIVHEYRLLSRIKTTYRRLQNDFFAETLCSRIDGEVEKHDLNQKNPFAVFLVVYLLTLVGLALANLIFVARTWI